MTPVAALRYRPDRLWIALFALLTFGGLHHTSAALPLYLGERIQSALDYRDTLVQRVGAPGDVAAKGFTTDEQVSALERFLARNRRNRPSEPWLSFYRGVSRLSTNPAQANTQFMRALSQAHNRPGALWVFYHEFLRYNQKNYADSSLAFLYRSLLANGANENRIVAQQLMFSAVEFQRTGQATQAEQTWEWAKRFDPDAMWPSLWHIRSGRAFKQSNFGADIAGMFTRLKTSWESQITLTHYLLLWLYRFVQVLVIGTFFVMFLKYFTHAIHPYVELFPQPVPLTLRSLLVAFVVIALGAFGTIPLIWVLALILWPTMRSRERLVAGLCLVLIALSPLGTWFETTLRSVRSPYSSAYHYARALDNGFDQQLHTEIIELAREKPDDRLAQLAASLSSLKGDSLQRALGYAKKAEQLAPTDPMVLTISGVAHFMSGKRSAAQKRFEQCVRRFPKQASGYYNLGQTFFEEMNTLEGADLIDKAQKVGGTPIKHFLHTNDSLFNNRHPQLRRFILSDYPPGYFWTEVFDTYHADWADATTLWGLSFLGLPPLWSLGIFALLLLVLLVRESIVSARRRSRAKKVLTCELCRAPMCKRCSRGPYCGTCYDKLSVIQVESQRQRAKVRLHMNALRLEAVFASLLDILFGGMGMLFQQGNKLGRVGVILIFLTSLLYGLVITLLTNTYSYPQWVSKGLYTPVYALAGIYVFIFVVRAILRIHRTLTTEAK